MGGIGFAWITKFCGQVLKNENGQPYVNFHIEINDDLNNNIN